LACIWPRSSSHGSRDEESSPKRFSIQPDETK
jgi:hypothetical protein